MVEVLALKLKCLKSLNLSLGLFLFVLTLIGVGLTIQDYSTFGLTYEVTYFISDKVFTVERNVLTQALSSIILGSCCAVLLGNYFFIDEMEDKNAD